MALNAKNYHRTPEIGGRAGPKVIGVEELYLPTPLAAVLDKVNPAPLPGSTVELTLLAELWVSQSQRCEHERAVPITHL